MDYALGFIPLLLIFLRVNDSFFVIRIISCTKFKLINDKKNILKNQLVIGLLSPPTFHCSFIWSNMLYQVEYMFCIDCSKYIPKKLYKVHVRLHEKGDLERGVEEQDMIKDEVGVGIYLELWAGYDQVWGRSRTLY